MMERLRRRIEASGEMTVAEYMAECLNHPQYGYYATRDPFGQAGDFTTAPEISQMFGEIIGAWCMDYWDRMGRPKPFDLIELGPGRGTLMADLIRTAKALPDFTGAMRVHLVETSPHLRKSQADALSRVGVEPIWSDHFPDAPDGAPCLVIANEFFDALPILQFVAREGAWRERRISLGDTPDALRFIEGQTIGAFHPLVPGEIDVRSLPDGTIFEIRPTGFSIVASIADRISTVGGGALFIDYGHARSSVGDTFQAVHRHEYADPLNNPGECDLTAHVDFAMLRRSAEQASAIASGVVDQGAFLRALGIEARATHLTAGAAPAVAKDIDTALHRLISDDEMGTLFKAMAITAPDGPTPAGFASTL